MKRIPVKKRQDMVQVLGDRPCTREWERHPPAPLRSSSLWHLGDSDVSQLEKDADSKLVQTSTKFYQTLRWNFIIVICIWGNLVWRQIIKGFPPLNIFWIFACTSKTFCKLGLFNRQQEDSVEQLWCLKRKKNLTFKTVVWMRQDVNQRKGGFSESLTVGSDARNIKDERDLSGHVKIRVFSPFTMFTQRPTYKKWEKKKSVYHNKR